MTDAKKMGEEAASKLDYWPCACVLRDRAGNMTHIKLHHPSRTRCSVCGCKQPPNADALSKKEDGNG